MADRPTLVALVPCLPIKKTLSGAFVVTPAWTHNVSELPATLNIDVYVALQSAFRTGALRFEVVKKTADSWSDPVDSRVIPAVQRFFHGGYHGLPRLRDVIVYEPGKYTLRVTQDAELLGAADILVRLRAPTGSGS